MKSVLSKDPYNIIITGVGGQGNVMASRVLANMMVGKGFYITIGETFGASQRGGSVMSHIRVSARSIWSPQIPKGRADLIVGLEPLESIRVLKVYGNEEVKALTNSRPIYPTGVIAGEMIYPTLEELERMIKSLTASAWFVNATEEAMKLGNPIFSNIIMIGAIAAIDDLPLRREDFSASVLEALPQSKLETNLKAYDIGTELMKAQRSD